MLPLASKNPTRFWRTKVHNYAVLVADSISNVSAALLASYVSLTQQASTISSNQPSQLTVHASVFPFVSIAQMSNVEFEGAILTTVRQGLSTENGGNIEDSVVPQVSAEPTVVRESVAFQFALHRGVYTEADLNKLGLNFVAGKVTLNKAEFERACQITAGQWWTISERIAVYRGLRACNVPIHSTMNTPLTGRNCPALDVTLCERICQKGGLLRSASSLLSTFKRLRMQTRQAEGGQLGSNARLRWVLTPEQAHSERTSIEGDVNNLGSDEHEEPPILNGPHENSTPVNITHLDEAPIVQSQPAPPSAGMSDQQVIETTQIVGVEPINDDHDGFGDLFDTFYSSLAGESLSLDLSIMPPLESLHFTLAVDDHHSDTVVADIQPSEPTVTDTTSSVVTDITPNIVTDTAPNIVTDIAPNIVTNQGTSTPANGTEPVAGSTSVVVDDSADVNDASNTPVHSRTSTSERRRGLFSAILLDKPPAPLFLRSLAFTQSMRKTYQVATSEEENATTQQFGDDANSTEDIFSAPTTPTPSKPATLRASQSSKSGVGGTAHTQSPRSLKIDGYFRKANTPFATSDQPANQKRLRKLEKTINQFFKPVEMEPVVETETETVDDQLAHISPQPLRQASKLLPISMGHLFIVA